MKLLELKSIFDTSTSISGLISEGEYDGRRSVDQPNILALSTSYKKNSNVQNGCKIRYLYTEYCSSTFTSRVAEIVAHSEICTIYMRVNKVQLAKLASLAQTHGPFSSFCIFGLVGSLLRVIPCEHIHIFSTAVVNGLWWP